MLLPHRLATLLMLLFIRRLRLAHCMLLMLLLGREGDAGGVGLSVSGLVDLNHNLRAL